MKMKAIPMSEIYELQNKDSIKNEILSLIKKGMLETIEVQKWKKTEN